MDLQVLFKTLWKRRWILILVPLFSVCVAFLVRLSGEWKFRSTARMATGITTIDEVIDNGKGLNPYEIQVTFNNLLEIMKSRPVMSRLSYSLLLHDISGDKTPFRTIDRGLLLDKDNVDLDSNLDTFKIILHDKIRKYEVLSNTDKIQKNLNKVLDAYEYDFESLLDELSLYKIDNSDYVEITYSSENPQLSAFVVNTFCDEFINYYMSLKADRSSVSLESLSEIVEQRRKYMDEKLQELKRFRSNNDIVDVGVESEAKIRQITQYENDISSEQQNIRGLQLTMASLNDRIAEAEGGMLNQVNQKIVELRRNINALNDQYITGGQSDARLLDSIQDLRKKLDATIKLSNERPKYSAQELATLKDKKEQTRIDLEVARENLASMTNILNSIRFSASSVAGKEAASNALEKEVDVAREEYLAAQERYNVAREKLVTNKAAIVQVQQGEPAEKPESRKTIVFMIFSGILSFSLCAFVIIMLELVDSRIKTPKRLKKIVKMPIAGVIPKLPKTIGLPNWRFFFEGNGHTQELHKLNNDLRKIRYVLDNSKSQVILVTSTQGGQGKTFFIMALAYTLSLIRKRTLIIDTNLRNNALTKMLTARASLRQLMEYYNRNIKQLTDGQQEDRPETESQDTNLITHTENDFVDIIGNKSSHLSPSEIIPGGDFKVLLEWLRVQYDYIIMEGASLNEFSDSRELATFVDTVIPIFSADASLSDKDKESLGFLKSLQEKLGPAVLNNYQPEEVS